MTRQEEIKKKIRISDPSWFFVASKGKIENQGLRFERILNN